MQGRKTEIRTDLHGAGELRAMAKGDAAPRTIKRLLALANALDGMTFTAAAKAAGLERQALGDAVKRYNAEGVAGLKDRPRSGRPRKLGAAEEASLAALLVAGPDPATDGISAYTLDDLCLLVETRFNQTYSDRGMSRLVKRLGFSRQKARPHHPQKDDAAQAAFRGAR